MTRPKHRLPTPERSLLHHRQILLSSMPRPSVMTFYEGIKLAFAVGRPTSWPRPRTAGEIKSGQRDSAFLGSGATRFSKRGARPHDELPHPRLQRRRTRGARRPDRRDSHSTPDPEDASDQGYLAPVETGQAPPATGQPGRRNPRSRIVASTACVAGVGKMIARVWGC